jgi:hypothetical protein
VVEEDAGATDPLERARTDLGAREGGRVAAQDDGAGDVECGGVTECRDRQVRERQEASGLGRLDAVGEDGAFSAGCRRNRDPALPGYGPNSPPSDRWMPSCTSAKPLADTRGR